MSCLALDNGVRINVGFHAAGVQFTLEAEGAIKPVPSQRDLTLARESVLYSVLHCEY
jgi:hypothetical protein